MPVVGFLGAESATTNEHLFEAFRQGMRDHGYIEGQNITLEARWAEGRSERFPGLIDELLRLKALIILALSLTYPMRSLRSGLGSFGCVVLAECGK
jgi:putative ABC transport system substrate-binding protein